MVGEVLKILRKCAAHGDPRDWTEEDDEIRCGFRDQRRLNPGETPELSASGAIGRDPAGSWERRRAKSVSDKFASRVARRGKRKEVEEKRVARIKGAGDGEGGIRKGRREEEREGKGGKKRVSRKLEREEEEEKRKKRETRGRAKERERGRLRGPKA